MNRHYSAVRLLWVGAALLSFAAIHQPRSLAATYYTTDTTVSTDIGVRAVIGYASQFDLDNKRNPSSPTITVVGGGRFRQEGSLVSSAYNASVLNISGGFVDGAGASDTATINAYSGTFAGLFASGNGTINIYGGETDLARGNQSYSAFDSGTFNLFAGTLRGSLRGAGTNFPGGIPLYHLSVFNLQGGSVSGLAWVSSKNKMTLAGTTVGSLEARELAEVAMTAGSIGANALLYNTATLKMTGGSIGGNLTANHSTVVISEISNASIGGSVSLGNAPITVHDATIGGSFSATFSNVTMSWTDLTGSFTSLDGLVTMDDTTVGGNVRINGSGEISSSTIGSLIGRGRVTMTGGDIVTNVTTESGWAADFDLTVGLVGGNVTSQSEGQIDLTGATIGGSVTVRNTSRTSLHGGSVAGNVTVFDTGTFGLDDGALVAGTLSASGSNAITINGGSILGGLTAGAASNVNVSSALLGSIDFSGNVDGRLTLAASIVTGDVNASGAGAISIAGGSVGGSVIGNATAGTLDITGAAITGDLSALTATTLTLSNTTVGNLLVSHASSATLSGNTVIGTTTLTGTAVVVANSGLMGGAVIAGGNSDVTLRNFLGSDLSVVGEANVTIDGASVAGNTDVTGGKLTFKTGGIVGNLTASAGEVEITGGVIGGNLRSTAATVTGSDVTINGSVISEAGASVSLTRASISGSTNANGANLDLTASTIDENLALVGTGSVVMAGGTVGGFVFHGGLGTVKLSGTIVTGDVDLDGLDKLQSVVETHAGAIGGDATVSQGQLYLFNTPVGGNVVANGNNALLIHLGTVANDVDLVQTSFAQIDGATIEGVLHVRGSSKATVVNSQIGALSYSGSGEVISVVESKVGPVTVSGGIISLRRSRTGSIFIGGGDLGLNDKTVVNGTVTVTGAAQLVVQESYIFGELLAKEQSIAFLDGAEARVTGTITADGNALVIIRDGVFSNLTAGDTASISISGGNVVGSMVGYGHSAVELLGGSIEGNVTIYDKAIFNWFGGTVAGLPPTQDENLLAMAASVTETPLVTTFDNAVLNIYGTDLAATLIDPNYQETFSLYQLTGTLGDGTSIGQYFTIQNGTGASYQLLPPEAFPEPASLSLVAFAALSLVRRRRRGARAACCVPRRKPSRCPRSRPSRSSTPWAPVTASPAG